MSTSVATAIVTADGLTKSWPAGGGLAPVDLAVQPGELTVVRGRSGSGKSTLLALLAGWCQPDAGELRWRSDVVDSSWAGVALMPQVIALAPELSIAENIGLPLRLAGVHRRPRAAMVREAMQQFDIDELADRLPAETSMGQRQRAALARALIGRPQLALVDEPTSHQDGAHAECVVVALRRAAGRGSALLVATHDQAVIDAADHVIDLGA